jgi:hypothetical protein
MMKHVQYYDAPTPKESRIRVYEDEPTPGVLTTENFQKSSLRSILQEHRFRKRCQTGMTDKYHG